MYMLTGARQIFHNVYKFTIYVILGITIIKATYMGTNVRI